MIFPVFSCVSNVIIATQNTKPSKKHNRYLGNERHGSIRLFGIMSNKRPGGNMLMNVKGSILAKEGYYLINISEYRIKEIKLGGGILVCARHRRNGGSSIIYICWEH